MSRTAPVVGIWLGGGEPLETATATEDGIETRGKPSAEELPGAKPPADRRPSSGGDGAPETDDTSGA